MGRHSNVAQRELRRGNARSPSGVRVGFRAQIGFAAFIGLALLAHAGSVVNLAFAAAAAMVATFLFFRTPSQYLGFCMWLWMLTPFVRRVVDWETEYHTVSLVMVAPALASAISAWSAFRYAPRLLTKGFLPFSIVMGICIYGLFLGTLAVGLTSAVYACLVWIAPVFIGVHILAHPEQGQASAKALFGAMAWGTLVIGAYGVWQYYEPQAWDVYWIVASEFTTAGLPEAQQIRVFSTMNSPAPFAYVMMAGLVVLLGEGRTIRWLAAPPGLTAFMLSAVRSAWGGLVVAMAIVILTSPARQKAKYTVMSGALVAVALPLLTLGPIANVVQARLNTVSSIEGDSSYQDRVEFYGEFFQTAVTTPFGTGLGATGLASRLSTSDNSLGELGNFDSGIMDVFYTFGWLGAVLLWAVGRMITSAMVAAPGNSYAVICAAIAGGTAAQLLFADTLVGASGMLVFPFAALAIVQREGSELSRRQAISRRGKLVAAE